jgi:DNA repair exonuclease SbcCD ATPase subunit
MKLLSLKVEHFRCIKSAKVEFADGLNVLHGPNDLGKSSLAHAIRAAFLLTTTATEYKQFVSWQASGDPYVELAFETEPQRIWRVRKTFGTATAFLDFSKDGVDYSPECRGRQVDERLSEILRWGVAPPGGKGRPKGMPMTFLTAALLAEQEKAGAIFSQALADDSDESGKKQLISALHAMAEDPTFKSVLMLVQERVDEAFKISADGSANRKRGRNSPWVKIREEISRKQEYFQECEQELQKTAAIEAEIQQLEDQRIDLKDGVGKAQEGTEAVRRDMENAQRRNEIAGRVAEHRARLAEVRRQLRDLGEAEQAHAEGIRHIAELTKASGNAETLRESAAAQAQKEREKLDRLQSKDRARERQLEQTKLESRRNELRSQQLQHEAALGAIRAVEAAHGRVSALERELCDLQGAATSLLKRRESAEKERTKLGEEEGELRAVRSLFRWQSARDLVQQAEKSAAQLKEWQALAAAKRAGASAMDGAQPGFPLPSREKVDELLRLASDLRVAAAKLDVGLVVTVRPQKPLRATVQRDGERAALYDMSDAAFETTAQRKLVIDIEGVAEIVLAGGPADAREILDGLEKRWAAEARPLLQEAGASTIDELRRIIADASQRNAEAVSLHREAAQLDQRIADQPDWATLLVERQQELAALEQELGDSDLSELEKMVRKLKLTSAVEIEKRLEGLRGKLDALGANEKQLHSEHAAADARIAEKQQALAGARADRDRAQESIDGDWQEALRDVIAKQAGLAKELASIESDLERMAGAEDRNLAAAKRAVEAALKALSESGNAAKEARDRLGKATLEHATNEGLLKAKREAAAKLDEKGAFAALEQVEAELDQAPAPAKPATEETLAEAQHALDLANNQLAEIDRQIHAKRGALQQVGGEVARQKAEDAANELQGANDRARQIELEYEAWELLRTTLREAEQEEGTHLGHALAEPIARRFAALTTGRYGTLALGPTLETEGITVAGGNRMVDLLSVGTRDQLSTVFRLTLAEQLKTAVILDDQLAQSDSGRMLWVRELLKEVAATIQVIVFTCRPDDYAIAGNARGKKLDDGLLAHAVDLAKLIERLS